MRNFAIPGKYKLKYAIDASMGLATAHGIDEELGVGASLIHRDVRGPNYLATEDGTSFMLHDFNLAQLMKWDATTKKPCAYYKKECNEVSQVFCLWCLSIHFKNAKQKTIYVQKIL